MMQRGLIMKAYTLLVLATIVSILSLSCNQQKDKWEGSVEIVNGVRVAKNPIEPMYKAEDVCEIVETLSLGGPTKNSSEPLFFYIRPLFSIDIDAEENIYVMDDRECKIFIFNKTGEMIKNFGVKGQGPGELQSPRSVDILPRSLSEYSLTA